MDDMTWENWKQLGFHYDSQYSVGSEPNMASIPFIEPKQVRQIQPYKGSEYPKDMFK